MSDHDQESQSRWLEAIGHRIAELKEGIGATTQRFERIAAIKDELESIRKSIWERNRVLGQPRQVERDSGPI